MKYFYPLLILTFILNNNAYSQCEILDYEIKACISDTTINLMDYVPNENGTYEYFVNGMEIQNSQEYDLSGNTTLNVVFTEDNTGCVDSFEIRIVQLNPPIVSVPNLLELDCIINITLIELDIGGSNTFSINWVGPNGFSSSQLMPEVSMGGIYDYTLIDSISTCVVDGYVEVIDNENYPSIEIDTLNNCNGTIDLIGISNQSGPEILFSWFGPGDLNPTSGHIITIDTIGLYFLEVMNLNNGCSNIDTIQIDNLDCSPNSSQLFAIDADLIIAPNPFYDIVQIEYGEESEINYVVINNLGKIMVDYSGINNQLNTVNWPSGNYYIGVISNNFITWRIIQKLK